MGFPRSTSLSKYLLPYIFVKKTRRIFPMTLLLKLCDSHNTLHGSIAQKNITLVQIKGKNLRNPTNGIADNL